VQGRLRRVFSENLSIVVEWHAKVLREAQAALLERDEAAGWRPAAARGVGGVDPGGGAGRLDSARALILECRSQSDNSLPVLRQSSASVTAFADAISGVLTVRIHAADATCRLLPSGFSTDVEEGGYGWSIEHVFRIRT